MFGMTYKSEDQAENVKSVTWLPKSMSDISYYKTQSFGWIKEYKCNISEQDFRNYAKEKSWELTSPKAKSIIKFHRLKGMGLIVVERALFYSKRSANGGGESVLYDLNTETLYYTASHR